MNKRKCIIASLGLLGVFTACDANQGALDCAQGWWVDSTTSTCSTCATTSPNPECAYADCQQFSCEGFFVGHAVFDGVVTYSKTAGTISAVGPGVWRQYTIKDGKIELSGAQSGSSLSCGGAQLKGSYSYQIRASQDVASALSTAVANKAISFRGIRTGA